MKSADSVSWDLQDITRRSFVRATVAAGAVTLWPRLARAEQSREVAWLAEVQRPPEKLPADAVTFSPLLQSNGAAIDTLEKWEAERSRLRRAWLEFLGPMPAERPPVKLQVLEEDNAAGCQRQLVRYESEAGLPVEGYLLRPGSEVGGKSASGKRAAIVALHQTSKDSISEIAGVKGPELQHLGLQLARAGFIVFCPRCFLWQDAPSYVQAVADFKKRHPGTLGMHKMLWDAMRGVDVLASLPAEVDANRIGTVGHSLGAKETLYLAAFDERVRAGVASEGGIGFNFTNWDAPWYLGPGIKESGFALNHHQLLALIAPRPFLILAGESGSGAADGDRTWPFVEAALPVYRLYGKTARLGLYNHRQGHSIPPLARTRLIEWLTTYLGAG